MNIGKLSYYARKTHRILMILIIVTGGIMMATGMTMKYPDLSPIDPQAARQIHNTVSTAFGLVFSGMMLTGLVMYMTPWFIKIYQKPIPPPKQSN